MNKRRNLLIVLGAAAFAPLAVFGQSKQPILIGWLSIVSREAIGLTISQDLLFRADKVIE